MNRELFHGRSDACIVQLNEGVKVNGIEQVEEAL